MYNKPVIFVVIAVIVVALVYSPAATTFYVFAAPPNRGFLNSESCSPPFADVQSGDKRSCCWNEHGAEGITFRMCQTCTWTEGVGYSNCNKPRSTPIGSGEGIVAPLEEGVLEQPPAQPSGPAAPLQGGVLEQLEQGEGAAPPFVPGFLERQQQPPTDQEAAELPPPATVEGEPVPPCPEGQVFNEGSGLCVPEDCPEGQVLDEESGICVLEEPETAGEEPAQSDPEEEQPSEESDSGDESNN